MPGWTHEDFFPYETYRQEQRDLMRYIEMDARLGKNILLLAPNMNELDVKYLLPGHMGISENGNEQIQLSHRIVMSL